MTANVTGIQSTANRRTTALIMPREHGAWGLLLVPLATGGAVGMIAGGSLLPLIALTLAALSLFWLRTPVESLFGTAALRAHSACERQFVSTFIMALSTIAACALASLVWNGRNRELLALGVIAAGSFGAQAVLRKLSRGTRILSQILGTIGLTVTAPAAYYVTTGRLNRTALALWLANLLFAGDQIHYVQLRIHTARVNGWRNKLQRGAAFLSGEVMLIAALFAGWYLRLFPAMVAVAFIAVLYRGTEWFFQGPESLAIRKLGWSELAHAIFFGVVLVVSFQLGS